MNIRFLLICISIFFYACSPSDKDQQAMLDNAKNNARDSIERIKRTVDSINREQKRLKDSANKAEEQIQHREDSLNNTPNSQRWIYEVKQSTQEIRVGTLNSSDNKLTVKVMDKKANYGHTYEIYFYCDNIKLTAGLFRGKSTLQLKINGGRSIEFVIVESGICCAKIRNLYQYTSDFKNYLQEANYFEICLPTTEGWTTFQFTPERVLDMENLY